MKVTREEKKKQGIQFLLSFVNSLISLLIAYWVSEQFFHGYFVIKFITYVFAWGGLDIVTKQVYYKVIDKK